MINKFKETSCVAACLVALGGMAHAEEDAETMLDAAMEYMHHSCESVLESYPDDNGAVLEIVRQMAFVSLYNREIDVFALVPDEAERDALKDEFTEELEDACDDDPGRLLAGAVDDAVKNTLAPYD